MKSILNNGLKQIYSTQITQPLPSVALSGSLLKTVFSVSRITNSQKVVGGEAGRHKNKETGFKRENQGVLMERKAGGLRPRIQFNNMVMYTYNPWLLNMNQLENSGQPFWKYSSEAS